MKTIALLVLLTACALPARVRVVVKGEAIVTVETKGGVPLVAELKAATSLELSFDGRYAVYKVDGVWKSYDLKDKTGGVMGSPMFTAAWTSVYPDRPLPMSEAPA